MAIEQIETEDVKVNLYNNVTKESVVKAVNEELLELSDDIINEKKKQDIIDLIKEGKTKEIQTQLGMKDNVHADLKERADNMFGKRTLENLKAGKVVGQKETSDTDKKPDITKASEEKQGIEGKDDFGNDIIKITAINEISVPYTWTENKVYDINFPDVAYRFYGNGRTAVTKGDKVVETKNTADIIDEVKNSISALQTQKENFGDISKELDPDMYHKNINKIKEIKTIDFINEYKVKYPGVEKFFDKDVMKHLLTVDENNPYFNILYTGGQTKNISIRECMDPKTFAFSKDKLFEKFINELKPIIEANNTKEKNEIEANNIKERNDNIEKAVRGKLFSKSELFPNLHDEDDTRYPIYFKKFSSDFVKIDAGSSHTKIVGDKLVFDLDDAGLDENYNKNQSISLDKIINEKGIVDEEKLKKELAIIISGIIEANMS